MTKAEKLLNETDYAFFNPQDKAKYNQELPDELSHELPRIISGNQIEASYYNKSDKNEFSIEVALKNFELRPYDLKKLLNMNVLAITYGHIGADNPTVRISFKVKPQGGANAS